MTKYENEKLANQYRKVAEKIHQMELQIVGAIRANDLELARHIDFATIRYRVSLGKIRSRLLQSR